MFRGFQLTIGPSLDLSKYIQVGIAYQATLKQELKPHLSEYIAQSGAIDGSSLQEDWFSELENLDVFISHSHADRDLAAGLAVWLYQRFNLHAFIDSMVWGNCSELLRDIDNEYCWNTSTKNYNYTSRNHSTAHVHMMLNGALNRMIDQCECIIFLKTPQSTVKDIVQDKTESAWIYSEIAMSRTIRKKVPKRATSVELVKAFSGGGVLNEDQRKKLKIEYFLQLDHLMPLTGRELARWDNSWNALENSRRGHALDRLYQLMPLPRAR